ncbi:MFS transporter [Bifidobacterium psychraerophilum]|uniref:Major facilitator transporter n=1 Tax=Bifidobacterium psychraerophilum TaxID=218140 RepID=A0A087CJ35_9BIFI|nr:MFS transporter [Bifidobacterium psychraerophilum]KFI83285.1 major facilitator transporter [Bifidobacterium psychraerophilum]PKA94340.1 Na+/melibiose symporter-like transporter [Bifidobacterium psychraerophilum DSM 22366]
MNSSPEVGNGADSWSGTENDTSQKKAPWIVGVALVLGTFLWMGPYMGVNVVLLPAKAAVIDPDSKAAIVAVLSTSAMIVAAIANIIFGALSDLTRSRWGRRTPWIVCGSVLAAASLVLVSMAPNTMMLIISWCVYQCFLNAIVAPLIAVLADRTAPKFRGTITSMYALGYSVGIYGGQMIGARFLGNISTGYYVLAALTLLAGPLAAVLMREQSSLGMPRKSFTWRTFIDHFSFPTKGAKDYYLALFGKFLIVAAKFSISGFMLYILTDYMKQNQSGAAYYVSLISLCMMVTAIVMTVIAGPISDKIKSRKIPVIVSSLLVAIGSAIPFFWNDPRMMIVYALIAGTGMGAYNSVDQALNIEVLPNKDTAAKDLGILNLSNTGGQVFGPVLAASLITWVGYHALFPLAAVCSLIGAVLIVFIKKVR